MLLNSCDPKHISDIFDEEIFAAHCWDQLPMSIRSAPTLALKRYQKLYYSPLPSCYYLHFHLAFNLLYSFISFILLLFTWHFYLIHVKLIDWPLCIIIGCINKLDLTTIFHNSEFILGAACVLNLDSLLQCSLFQDQVEKLMPCIPLSLNNKGSHSTHFFFTHVEHPKSPSLSFEPTPVFPPCCSRNR